MKQFSGFFFLKMWRIFKRKTFKIGKIMSFLKSIITVFALLLPTFVFAQNRGKPQIVISPTRVAPATPVRTLHFVRTFAGTIGKNAQVVMQLRRNDSLLMGSYYYSKGEKYYIPGMNTLYLEGTINDNADFTLREFEEIGKQTGILKGTISYETLAPDAPYEILGTWQKDSAAPKQHLQLRQQHYMLSDSAALVETDVREENWQYSIDIVRPAITRGFKTEGFTRAVDSVVVPLVEGFKEDAYDWDVTDSAVAEMFKEMKHSLDGRYDVMLAENNLISLRFTFSTYFVGAAHPTSFSHTLNYDLSADKQLQFSDVFTNENDVLKIFSDYARTDFLKRGISDKEWIYEGTEPTAENFRSWNITPKGFLLTFDQYQVASYAEGPQEVEVPVELVKKFLKK
jgi:hypothetical protein